MKVIVLGKICILMLLMHSRQTVYSQGEMHEKTIKSNINTFFEGLNKKDTLLIQTTLAKEVSMTTLLIKAGEEQLVSSDMSAFIKQIGRLGDLDIEERISNISVHVYFPLATVAMDYSFYVNNELSHSGINIFKLAYIEKKWKIISISDSRK